MIKQGIYNDEEMSIDNYHADRDYISSSKLKEFMLSPAHLEALYAEPTERKSYLDFGHVFELMLLESETVEDHVYIIDDAQMIALIGGKRPTATTAYKKWLAAEHSAAGDKFIINKSGNESMETIHMLVDKCMADPVISALVNNIQYQSSVFWKDTDSGMLCKTRPDVIHINKHVVLDIKTTVRAAPSSFGRDAAKFGYPLQAALQMRGVVQGGMMDAVDLYYYLVVENQAPNNIQLYRLTDEDIVKANEKLDDVLMLYKLYKEGKIRHGYNFRADNKHGILDLNIPQYYWYD